MSTTWREHTDDSLVEYAASHRDFAQPAAMEMQRRSIETQRGLIAAVQASGDCASTQTAEVIKLTNTLRVLTIVLVVIGAIQIGLMFWK